MTIFKYHLVVADIQTVDMPIGARILAVQVQHGVPCLWAAGDPWLRQESRVIVTYGTGHDIPHGGLDHYIGTYQLEDGDLVYHVAEQTS